MSLKRPTTPPYLTLAFFILSFADACFQIFYVMKNQHHDASQGFLLFELLTVVISFGLICTIGSLPVRDKLPGPDVASGNEVSSRINLTNFLAPIFVHNQPPSSCRTNPEDSVTLWQWCSFSFMGRMLKLSLERRIEPDDVWRVSPLFKHKSLFSKYISFREK